MIKLLSRVKWAVIVWLMVAIFIPATAQANLWESVVDAVQPVPNLSKEEEIAFKEDILTQFLKLKVPFNGKNYTPIEVFRIASDTTQLDDMLTNGADTTGGVVLLGPEDQRPEIKNMPFSKRFLFDTPLAVNTLNFVNGRCDVSDVIPPDGNMFADDRDKIVIGAMATSQMIYYMYKQYVYKLPEISPREYKRYNAILPDAIPYFYISKNFKSVDLVLTDGIVKVKFDLKITTRGNELNSVELKSMPTYTLYYAPKKVLSIKDADLFYRDLKTNYFHMSEGAVLDPITWDFNLTDEGAEWVASYYGMDRKRTFNLLSGFFNWGIPSL